MLHVTGTWYMLHITGTVVQVTCYRCSPKRVSRYRVPSCLVTCHRYMIQVHVTWIQAACYRYKDSPKRVSRYRVPSCLPLGLKMRVGCEGNRGGIQESLKLFFYQKFQILFRKAWNNSFIKNFTFYSGKPEFILLSKISHFIQESLKLFFYQKFQILFRKAWNYSFIKNFTFYSGKPELFSYQKI